jgi:hypothetical protein
MSRPLTSHLSAFLGGHLGGLGRHIKNDQQGSMSLGVPPK